MLTLGVDLSTDPRSTGACLLGWTPGGVEILRLAPEQPGGELGLEEIVSMIGRADGAGIDAPFGWPEQFVRAVSGWESMEPWTAIGREPLRYRATDLEVRGKPRLPLSVSTERLGATAMYCASILSRLKDVDRSGASGEVAEVYPAAALHKWGLTGSGYKAGAEDARELRIAILSGLMKGLGGALDPGKEREMRLAGEHDMLDALVAALVARAVQLGKTARPATAERRRLAAIEGWIHVPDCELDELI